MPSETAIVIGAGIVGLAMARSLAERGYAVTVFERNEKATGASIRNFGMIWPIGQPEGKLYQRALRSKGVWKQVATEAGLWFEEKGSLHLAYNDLEWQVLQEFAAQHTAQRPVALLSSAEVARVSEAAVMQGLKGALYSSDEMIIESRVAMERLPSYLTEKYGVQFHFNTAITSVTSNKVVSGRQTWTADLIVVCSGADFETLYPEVFADGITKCKLQMMRLQAQPQSWRIGPSLCGGLSLIHYKSFSSAPSLPLLKKHYHRVLPQYLDWGIHVMVSQNEAGELTIGDSHEYGLTHDPFDRQFINEMIIDYLKQFAFFRNWQVVQSWHGIYAKLKHGGTEWVLSPEPGVLIVNGLGGNGMTLSFGLAEEVTERIKGHTLVNTATTVS